MKSTLVLGVDVSKGYGDFVLLDAHKRVVEPPFRLDDNKQGHDILKKQLLEWKKNYRVSRLLLVTESTGGYEDNWLRISKDKALSFVESYRINAKIIFHEYQAQRRNSIDDGVSAITIAEHVVKNLENFTVTSSFEETPYTSSRSLIRHYVSLQEESSSHKNALVKLLYQYLPSLEALKPREWPIYWIEIFVRYGSRKSIQIAASKGFKQLKRVPPGKAKEIAEALANGIDMRETPAMVVYAIRSKARQIKRLMEEIKEVKKMIIEVAPVDAQQVSLLKSIKGMGDITPVILLSFIEEVGRFGDAKQMACFFGVQPRVKKSGDGAYRAKMSKQGAGLVRRELYLLAFRTLNKEPYLRAIYAKSRAKGMVHNAAIGVLMHKILRMIYGMLISNTPFNVGIDQLNQHQVADKPKEKRQKKDTSRRFQPPSMAAPISGRQRRKRKKDYELQADGISESTESS
jgi:transposase